MININKPFETIGLAVLLCGSIWLNNNRLDMQEKIQHYSDNMPTYLEGFQDYELNYRDYTMPKDMNPITKRDDPFTKTQLRKLMETSAELEQVDIGSSWTDLGIYITATGRIDELRKCIQTLENIRYPRTLYDVKISRVDDKYKLELYLQTEPAIVMEK